MVIAVLEVSLKGVAVPWQWFRPMRSNWACGPSRFPTGSKAFARCVFSHLCAGAAANTVPSDVSVPSSLTSRLFAIQGYQA